MDDILLIILAGLVGLSVGSFLNVVIYRTPLSVIQDIPLNLFYPGSACMSCRTKIRIRDLIPIVSWLLLQGRCRICGARVSCRYPVTELLFMCITVIMALSLPLSLTLAGSLTFLAFLIVLTAIDTEHKLLPDVLTLPLLWSGMMFSAVDALPDMEAKDSIAGACTGYVVMWTLREVFLWVRKTEALGLGDVKFCAALGAWTGLHSLSELLLIASAGGVIFILLSRCLLQRKNDPELPFGPFLSAAAIIIYFRSLLQ